MRLPEKVSEIAQDLIWQLEGCWRLHTATLCTCTQKICQHFCKSLCSFWQDVLKSTRSESTFVCWDALGTAPLNGSCVSALQGPHTLAHSSGALHEWIGPRRSGIRGKQTFRPRMWMLLFFRIKTFWNLGEKLISFLTTKNSPLKQMLKKISLLKRQVFCLKALLLDTAWLSTLKH